MIRAWWQPELLVNTLRPRQDGRRFPDDTFKRIFLNENVWIPIKISLKFVHKGRINNIPALVQIMAWRRPGDKPLSEPMMVSLPLGLDELNLKFELPCRSSAILSNTCKWMTLGLRCLPSFSWENLKNHFQKAIFDLVWRQNDQWTKHCLNSQMGLCKTNVTMCIVYKI